jgi:hypothetical protein
VVGVLVLELGIDRGLDDRGPPGDRADRAEGADRILEMTQQGAAEDQVESPHRLRRELVDAAEPVLDPRAEAIAGELEALDVAGLHAVCPTARARLRQPVPFRPIGDIGRDHALGAAALQLEGEEPVCGADVERGHALE